LVPPQRAVEPHLETAGRQQLTGNQTKKKKKKKAQSVPERFRSRTKQPGDSQEAEVRKDLG
jgi:hypothetical protein